MSVPKTYRLTPKKKAALVAYLKGEITQVKAAQVLGVQRQYVCTVVTGIIRELVAEGSVEITKLLKHY